MDGRCPVGGIVGLCRIAAEHRTQLAGDLRSHYGVSLWDLGVGLSWVEFYHLVEDLLNDPTSRLFTAMAGNKFPFSREWVLLADIFDVLAASNSKRKPKPYPRAWPEKQTRIGGKKKMRRSSDEVRAILRPLN